MALAFPLLVMMVALTVAWGLGTAVRGRPVKTQQIVGVLGVAALLFVPIGYEATIFDGNCYGLDGTASPCALGERLTQSFTNGLAFMIAPALIWVLIYVMALNTPR